MTNLESPWQNNISLEVVGAGEAIEVEVSIGAEASLCQIAPIEPSFLLVITFVVGIGGAVEFYGIEPALDIQ